MAMPVTPPGAANWCQTTSPSTCRSSSPMTRSKTLRSCSVFARAAASHPVASMTHSVPRDMFDLAARTELSATQLRERIRQQRNKFKCLVEGGSKVTSAKFSTLFASDSYYSKKGGKATLPDLKIYLTENIGLN